MKNGKKLLSLLLAFVLVFALCGGALAEAAPAAEAKDIVILHTNDVHGSYNKGMGYAGLAALKKSLAEENYVTLVDAGDFSQGSTMSTLSKGEYIIELMNAVGYDIVVPGNHEFDYGMPQALKNLGNINAKVVSCNFVAVADKKPVFDAYTVVEYGDVKVAYVGISTPETYTKSTPAYFQDEAGKFVYSFCEGSFYETVQTAIDAAAAEADYVVAVGHCGVDPSSTPWTSKEIIANTTGIVAFIDGHSHTTIPGEVVANKDGKDVVLAQTGEKLGKVGKVTLKADGTVSAELISEFEGSDEAVAARITEIEDSYKEVTSQVVAQSEVELVYAVDGKRAVRNSETNMGDLIADAYRVVMGADIGIMNGGGIRAGIPAGEIKLENILAVMTFGNMATVVKATGQQIIDCLEMGAAAYPNESGGFVHVSGLSYTINAAIKSSVVKDEKGGFASVAGARRVRDVMVDGKPIDLTKTYTVACHSYWLTNYGDGMNMFKGCEIVPEKHEVYVDNVMMSKYIQENLKGVVTAEQYGKPQGRIKIVDELYADVPASAWYYDCVMSVSKSGLMTGTGEATFSPNGQLTRSMFVTMLYRLAGQPAVEGKVSETFTDCADGTWYSDAVVWGNKNGIVTGNTATTFAPDAALTREAMAALLYRYAKCVGAEIPESVELSYTDASAISSWAQEAVSYCTTTGLMNGTGAGFEPTGGATRAMGAKVLSLLGSVTAPAAE